MARRSQGKAGSVLMSALLSLASLSATGCIVADPPDYGPAQRSPIYLYNPHPNPWSVQVLTRLSTGMPPVSTIVPFGATVRAEDAGEQLVALRYLDYQHGGSIPIPKLYAPATLEDERQVVFDIIPSRDFPLGGCHSITIMVMHFSSWNQDAGKFEGPPEDLAQESWIVAVDNLDGTLRVADCPLSTAEQ